MEKLHGRPGIEVIEEFFSDKTEQVRKKLHRECEQFDMEHTIRLVPGVEKLLNSLRNHAIPVGLVTSLLPSKVLNSDNFSVVVTSADVKEGKPHPECYRKAVQAPGLDAEECIVFEDSVNGVRSANTAGLSLIGVNKLILEDLLKEQGARAVIPNFSKIELKQSENGAFSLKFTRQTFSISLSGD